MTTLTVSPLPAFSSEQPDTVRARAEARAAAMTRAGRYFMGFLSGSVSTQQVGHVDGDGAGGTAGRAGAAVPALVDVHVRLAVVGVDRERVQRADLHAERAALDAQRFVDGHRDIRPVLGQSHLG